MDQDELDEGRVWARHDRLYGAVLIIGAGAVGGFLARELAQRGVSPLILVDRDVLQDENLIRHPLGQSALRQPKATALAEYIRSDKAPWCDARGVPADFLKLPEDEQLRLAGEVDLVVAATGTDDCNRRINEICLRAEKPAVYPTVWVGAGVREGEVSEILWVQPGRHTPCYECSIRWRRQVGEGHTGHGMATDIMALVLPTVEVIAGLLNPRDERARILDPEQTVMLVHGIMPPASEDIRRFFASGSIQYMRVLLREEPCSVCGIRRQMTSPERTRPAATGRPPPPSPGPTSQPHAARQAQPAPRASRAPSSPRPPMNHAERMRAQRVEALQRWLDVAAKAAAAGRQASDLPEHLQRQVEAHLREVLSLSGPFSDGIHEVRIGEQLSPGDLAAVNRQIRKQLGIMDRPVDEQPSPLDDRQIILTYASNGLALGGLEVGHRLALIETRQGRGWRARRQLNSVMVVVASQGRAIVPNPDRRSSRRRPWVLREFQSEGAFVGQPHLRAQESIARAIATRPEGLGTTAPRAPAAAP